MQDIRGNQSAFLLTRPSRGATYIRHFLMQMVTFLLTRPSRGATFAESKQTDNYEFLLTRPSRGATRETKVFVASDIISTHTPLAGRDP